ncbi:hypothetical protein DAI22_05g040400 [Oryza sativa Japonica Group]|nr:hypothetical protein DAI22_05g040400 [Oryza sativa Japonica Group]
MRRNGRHQNDKTLSARCLLVVSSDGTRNMFNSEKRPKCEKWGTCIVSSSLSVSSPRCIAGINPAEEIRNSTSFVFWRRHALLNHVILLPVI